MTTIYISLDLRLQTSCSADYKNRLDRNFIPKLIQQRVYPSYEIYLLYEEKLEHVLAKYFSKFPFFKKYFFLLESKTIDKFG